MPVISLTMPTENRSSQPRERPNSQQKRSEGRPVQRTCIPLVLGGTVFVEHYPVSVLNVNRAWLIKMYNELARRYATQQGGGTSAFMANFPRPPDLAFQLLLDYEFHCRYRAQVAVLRKLTPELNA